MAVEPQYTAGEIARVAWLVARMAKRGIAGEDVYLGDLQRKVDRIVEGAKKRAEKTANK